MKFYKRDPNRALAGMAELSLQERGAYNTLIDLLYSRDGVLPDDDEALRRIMGCHGHEWRAVKRKLIARGKVRVENGYLKANGVDTVIKEAVNFSQTQAKRASNRWENEIKRRSNSGKDEYNQASAHATKNMLPTPTPTPTPTPNKKKEEVVELDRIREKRERAKARTRIGNFMPSFEEKQEALEHWRSIGRSDLDVDAETQRFLDSHTAKGSTMADWPAAWRTWYRNAPKFTRQENGRKSGSNHANHLEGIRLLREEIADRRTKTGTSG